MSDGDFLLLAFNNIAMFSIVSLAFFCLLYYATRHTVGGLFWDPFHLTYAFTYGTSYAVVFLLWYAGLLSVKEEIIVWGYGIVFLFAFIKFSKNKPNRLIIKMLTSLENRHFSPKRVTIIMLSLYLLLTVIYIYTAGFGFLQVSRFEASRGVGGVMRGMDVLRIMLCGYSSIWIVDNAKKRKTSAIIISLLLLIFIIVSSLINGAKSAMVENVYAIILPIFLRGTLNWSKKTKFAILVLFGTLAIGLGAVTLSYQLKAVGVNTTEISSRMPGESMIVERAVIRVIANGDMYYMGLPNGTIDKIKIDNPVIRFLTPLVGSGILSSLLGYDVANYEVGRRIWLYWYPGDSVMRGPTNHFDLAAYVYFGLPLGFIFVVFIAFSLACLNSLRKFAPGKSVHVVVLISTLWLSGQIILVHPPIGFSKLVDVFCIATIIYIIESKFGVWCLLKKS